MLPLLLATAAHADPKPVDASVGKVEVTLDLPKDKPYVGEMIMLHMRSFIRADVVLDAIHQPPLTNFDSQQLGRDKPIEAMVDGYNVAGFERKLAIFPQQSGRLIIDPFTRHVTIANGQNERVQADFSSKNVFVDVQNYASINPPGAWWLPARALNITDSWSVQPDEIKQGTLSRRTIVVEAVGLTADRLPPPPNMQAPGTIVFKGPVNRETIVTEDGPIARATYVWELRPVSGSPAKLPAITIPWFDTSERRMRTASIPDVWVAYAGTLVHPSHEKVLTLRDRYFSRGPIVAALAGFAWTAALAGFLLTRRQSSPDSRRYRRQLAQLVRFGRYNDETGLRRSVAELQRLDPARWAQVVAAPRVASRLQAFDAARFGPDGGTLPELRALGADIAELWREGRPNVRRDLLPSLDGAVAAKRTWLDELAPGARRA